MGGQGGWTNDAISTLIIPTGATTGVRIVLDGTTGVITIYDAANVPVLRLSGLPNTIVAQDVAGGSTWALSKRTGDIAPAAARFLMSIDGGLGWGSGGGLIDVHLDHTAGGELTLGGAGGGSLIAGLLTASGGALVLGAAKIRTQLSAPVTVANSIAETAVATLTIPANDMVTNALYRISAWGLASVTGTPTLAYRTRIGGVAGTAMAGKTVTASANVTSHDWRVDSYLACISTGAFGSVRGFMHLDDALSVAGGAPFTPVSAVDGTVSVTVDTTVSQDFIVSLQWSAASAANTATCYYAECVRV